MPILRIDVTGPKTSEYKRALLAGAREAAVEALAVPNERVTVRLVETPAECVDVPGCRTDRYTVVELLMYEGRSEEMKRAFVSGVRERFGREPGIEPSEITVAIRDASASDLDAPAGQAGK